jgi:hypothetical protein
MQNPFMLKINFIFKLAIPITEKNPLKTPQILVKKIPYTFSPKNPLKLPKNT